MGTFYQTVNHLAHAHPDWDRRMCVLAARLYRGIDTIEEHERGEIATYQGYALMTEAELDAVASACDIGNDPTTNEQPRNLPIFVGVF